MTPRGHQTDYWDDGANGWYDSNGSQEPEQAATVPPRVNNLATFGLGPEVTNTQQGNLNGQTGAQGMSTRAADARPSVLEANATNADQRLSEIQAPRREIPPTEVMTDREMFTFLAEAQPFRLQEANQANLIGVRGATDHSAMPPSVNSCAAPTLPRGPEPGPAQPGGGVQEASPVPPSQTELRMLLTAIQTFVTELPKLELGDVGSRANRLISWKTAIEQAFTPAGFHLKNWWRWCMQKAEKAYKKFLQAHLNEREAIVPEEPMPVEWEQIDSWIRPKILEAMPALVKDWVAARGRQGKVDETHIVLYYAMRRKSAAFQ